MFLLYCDDLELNLQYLWGMPVFSCVDTISAVLHYFVQTIFPIWCHFHSAWRTSFGISWVKICCWWILSSFVCLRKYLFCLSKRFSLLIEFCLTVLSLQTLTMLLHHLLTCIIPSEKSAVIFIFVLVHHNMSLLLPNARLLATFVILLFIITVEQFEYDVFCVIFCLFVCFALASLSFLLCGLMVIFCCCCCFLPNLEKFWLWFLQVFFFFFLIPLPLSSPLLQQLHTGILNCVTI